MIKRYAHNPILTKAQIPYPVETVHNAAVVKHGNEYIMLFRSHLRTGRSIIGLARSHDGFQFTADPEPFLTPARDGPFAAYEEFGVEDPRVTRLEAQSARRATTPNQDLTAPRPSCAYSSEAQRARPATAPNRDLSAPGPFCASSSEGEYLITYS